MFKLAVITDEISQDLEVAIEMAKEFKLQAIEIRSVWEKGPHELDDADIARIKRMVSEAGLQVCGIASPFFKCDFGDESQEREHLQILRRCIRLAHALGTNLVRVFAFWRKEGLKPDWDAIAEKFQEPIRIAESEGVILGVENEPSTNGINAKTVAAFLQKLNHPNVRAVWDPGNDIFDPQRETPYPDGYRLIREWIVHVHLKDGVWNAEAKRYEASPLGKGEVDYIGQLRALKDDGYSGFLSLETHYRPKVALPEEIAQMPKGSQFSYLGDLGTRECLNNLMEMLKDISGWSKSLSPLPSFASDSKSNAKYYEAG